MDTQLLCTFTSKKQLYATIDSILDTYEIAFSKIFVLENIKSEDELMCTYNIILGEDSGNNLLHSTISLHRKKQTNTLYTINALNFVIELLNDGVFDSKFPIPWDKYRNCLLVTDDDGLKRIDTRIFDIIKIK